MVPVAGYRLQVASTGIGYYTMDWTLLKGYFKKIFGYSITA
jgi:hypothetical protein